MMSDHEVAKRPIVTNVDFRDKDFMAKEWIVGKECAMDIINSAVNDKNL